MSIIKLLDLANHGDGRGGLIAIEANRTIPFKIKRVYFIHSTKVGISRGFHAHLDLKQLAICVKGSCRFVLDDGTAREEVLLDSPNKGLYIDSIVWREMHDFSEDCVLLVLASEHYDEDDYIRHYNHFKNYLALSLVSYNEIFLEKSWGWLNDKEIKYLTMTPDFTREEQKSFFSSLKDRKNYYIYGVNYNDIPIGACGLKNVVNNAAELWLYIGEKDYWHKGLGKVLMHKLEKQARLIGLEKLYLKVLNENKRAIKLYNLTNYNEVKEVENYIVMEKIL